MFWAICRLQNSHAKLLPRLYVQTKLCLRNDVRNFLYGFSDRILQKECCQNMEYKYSESERDSYITEQPVAGTPDSLIVIGFAAVFVFFMFLLKAGDK